MEKQWSEMSVSERQAERFQRWLNPSGVKFVNAKAEQLYKTRVQRLINAIQLKESDRVPVEIAAGAFMAHYAGTSLHSIMYNPEESRRAFIKFLNDFDVDAFDGSGFQFPGQVYEAMGYKSYKWPGHGLEKDASMVQFVEEE
jgi:hypothetical protein